MKTSNNGITLIKKFEGCRLKAYKDAAGVLTIGYGHTSGVKAKDSITQEEAENLLKEDLEKIEKKVSKYNYSFNQNQFDALVSFAYNLGSIDKLSQEGKRSKEQIALHIRDYVFAGGRRLQGLVNRRQAEFNLYMTPVVNPSDILKYRIGKTYELQSNLAVRTGAGTSFRLVGYANLSADAKKHDVDCNGYLEKGTKVTCKDIRMDSKGNTWIKSPSGWLAAIYNGDVYIK